MRSRSRSCRSAALLGVAGVIAGGLTAVVVTPAAAEAFTDVARASWAYIDVREPRSTFAEGDAPVGASRDGNGRYHSSKAYFTFDLAELRGARVLEVSAQVAENSGQRLRQTARYGDVGHRHS